MLQLLGSPQTLSSVSTQGVFWALLGSPSLSYCLENREVTGLASFAFPSLRDHSFNARSSVSSNCFTYFIRCFQQWGKSVLLLHLGQKKHSHVHLKRLPLVAKGKLTESHKEEKLGD